MRFLLITTAAIACLAMNLPSGFGQALEIGGKYWEMKPSGSGAVGKDGNSGTSFDIKNDLGYRKKDILGFNAALGQGNQIILDYLSADVSGSGRLSKPVLFTDVTFPTGMNVHSATKADMLRLAYRMQSGSRGFRAGVIAGVEYLKYETDITGNNFATASGSAKAAVPIVGAQLRFDPASLVRIELSLVGSPIDIQDTRVDYWDAEANIQLNFRPFFVGLGYRQISLDAKKKSIPLKADLKFRGPQIVAGLAF
ncbi:MAG: hypothetical protein M5U15_01765 [Kiritimatiellae bacterium]|nr:hypothetical protein [Kiritimatiellia bacterium]